MIQPDPVRSGFFLSKEFLTSPDSEFVWQFDPEVINEGRWLPDNVLTTHGNRRSIVKLLTK